MLEQTLAIIRNTFFESIRQPIMLVVLTVATILIILSNPLSAFTMDNDQRMLIDIGLATVFISGAMLAAFIAANVLGREIDNRTVLTVVSKPISRPVFVIGKYLGVAGAMILATLYMAFVFLLTERHSVLQTVRDPYHVPVLAFGTLAFGIGLFVAAWCNYFYNKVFASTALCVTTPLVGLAYFLSLMFKSDFSAQPISVGFKPQLWLAIGPLIVAILLLSAIALAASTRVGQVMTLVITVGLFLGGLLSDWYVARPMQQMRDAWVQEAASQGLVEYVDDPQIVRIVGEPDDDPHIIPRKTPVVSAPLMQFATLGERVKYGALWTLYAVLPNFQVLMLSDALTQNHKIPPAYVARSMMYGGVYIIAALSLAVCLFQRREVG